MRASARFLLRLALVAPASLAVPAASRVASAQPEAPVDLVIVAPHPDDDVLIAAGVIARARALGKRVAVVVLTNGDFTCSRDGYAREAEAVNALAQLGVPEGDVHFLGYPDGYLVDLGATPLAPVERRNAEGACVRQTGTYANRGASGHDEHTARTGAPAPYTAAALEDDLASVLGRLNPRDLFVTHGIDAHPDHAATYAYVRRALDALDRLPAAPRLHRAVVHAGPCWPDGRSMREPCPEVVFDPRSAAPPLPEALGSYLPSERTAVDDPLRKLAAILQHHTQLGPEPLRDWLVSFARADEPFYPEVLMRDPLDPGRFRRAPARSDVVGRARATFTAGTPGALADVEVSVGDERGDERGAYRLRVAAGGTRVELARDGLPLRTWQLPNDSQRAADHIWELRIDPRPDEEVTELTISRDGHFLGVAEDPKPMLEVQALVHHADGDAHIAGVRLVAEKR